MSNYSSSAPTTSSFLENYTSEKAKFDLEKVIGAEVPPAIDFSAYKDAKKDTKGDNALSDSKRNKLATKPVTFRTNYSEGSFVELDLEHDNTVRDDTVKLLNEYTSSFTKPL